MTKINFVNELRKQGFKLPPLPPPTPKQMEEVERANQWVKNFLEKMEKARRASEHSKLRFATSKEENPSSDAAFKEEEVVGIIDIQKLSAGQKVVYDTVNNYFKQFQQSRKHPVPNFVVARHKPGRCICLNTQKGR